MTQLSRRALLRAGALAAAGIPFASMSIAEAATSSTNLYARTRFAPYINGAFTLAAGPATYRVVLTAIEDFGAGGRTSDPNRFRLIFKTVVAGPPQQTCTLSRPGFTATPLFVVPMGASLRTYEAVINRSA